MHKKRVEKNFQVHASSHKPMKKCPMKMKETKKKWHAHKSVIDSRKHFIGCLHKTGEDDWDKLWANDSGHSEGAICLVNG